MGILLRCALLCVLAGSVLAMHHVDPTVSDHSVGHAAMAVHEGSFASAAAGADSEEQPVPAGFHDFLHLCLAIICTAIGLVLLVRLLRRQAGGRWSACPPAGATATPAVRPPPVWGRGILHRVCVLRL